MSQIGGTEHFTSRVNHFRVGADSHTVASIKMKCCIVCVEVSVVLELQCPAEEPQRNMFGRQRREPTGRAPVRVVLVLDVSHSMSEPHGPAVDQTTNSQVTRTH